MPTEATLAACLQTLSNHSSQQPSVTVSSFKVNSRIRQKGQPVSDYVASLKKLSEHCELGNFLSDLVRDRIVSGINDEQMQTRLLEEHNPKLESAIALA
ncbi:MAG: hypothetical protein O7D30_08485, partial [Rickettsia endosymbiont of Ixodes persulcatus]|nr:hypothetical protein [Rickettsia endosymbiont of Ixodes persulcatus]